MRVTIFWIHLICGLVVGLVVAVLSFTGVALAFQPQLLEWAESDARRVDVPPGPAARLSLDALLERVTSASPELKVRSVTVSRAPDASVSLSTGEDVVYVNPWTGQVLAGGAPRLRAFFELMESWHRWLALEDDARPIGKSITGVANTAFLVLVLTGLFLWLPRVWTKRNLARVLFFGRRLQGKARDWNWHHVFGFWTAPVLVVLIVTGMVISYRWASNLVFHIAGSEPPAAGGRGGPETPPVQIPEGATRLTLDALIQHAQSVVPDWGKVTLRLPKPGAAQGAEKTAPPVALVVQEQSPWPLFAREQVQLHPYTGAVLAQESYASATPGRKLRGWMRFLHTGEALSWPGQLIAALASLSALMLVWTGVALSWRRFFAGRRTASQPSGAPLVES